jgi:chemotaxis protein MotA
MPAKTSKDAKGKPDMATLLGLLVALAGLIGGLLLEGGSIKDIAQVTAALIVLGGTLGATMINTPMDVLKRTAVRVKQVFSEPAFSPHTLLETLLDFASKARKNGLVALEGEAETIPDPFLRKALILAIDGTDLQEVKSMMEVEIGLEEERAEAEAKVLETAGGYAPTIGIIGAVMGLIQVMKHLENIEEVGHGIAVAFVATVYGVGIANLLLLPLANKMKARARQQTMLREMTLEGVSGIVEGLNPKLIRSKLEPYLNENSGDAQPKSGSSKRSMPEAA